MLILRHIWSVFVGLLILDVVFCGLWLLAIPFFPGLAGAQLADLMPLVLGYALIPVIAGMAITAGIARRVVSPDIETGHSNQVDLLTRPAAAGALMATVFALLVMLVASPSRSEIGEVATGIAIAFLSVSVVLALTTALFRRLTLRGLSMVALVVVGAAALALVVMNARGRSRLTAQQEAARIEVAAERKRQQELIRPVLAEPGLDVNAVDTYRALLSAQSRYLQENPKLQTEDLQRALKSPEAPPPPLVMAALEHARGDIDKLLEATRARRAVWPTEYEKGYRAELVPVFPARTLAQLALVDANLKAHEGDVQGASERYLAVLRFGADFASGPLTSTLMGAAIERMALNAQARFVRSPRALPVLDAIEAGLDRLEPVLPDLESGLRNERLLFAMTGLVEDPATFRRGMGVGSDGDFWSLIGPLVPWSAYQADAVDGVNATFRDLETVFARRDPEAWQKLEEESLPRYYNSNPSVYYRAVLPQYMRAHDAIVGARVLMDASQLGVALERRRAAEGRYPADPGPLPADLFARSGAGLRYQATEDGKSYVLYSVGPDHRDDGGKAPLDLLLPDAAWPSGAEKPRAGK